ncbi:hypothetical protein [Photobacterium profundum]|uniref:Uncharacterized protein n=1 Tax=Photobacterium profundum 3TCK TaxID=314280 RepID=Q1Z7E4_9GAMM|nr:hypothetical protein [Photobacterium profundum]EAS44515.1 hypothetical protein P3TCK_15200 [Photobacterium profundum 3TCK]
MKKLATICTAIMLSASFSTSAFILTGQEADLPEEAVKQCATAKNFTVCVNNYKQVHKK